VGLGLADKERYLPQLPFFSVFGSTSKGSQCMEVSDTMVEKVVKCPECGSQRVYKDGIRYTRSGEMQRYLCRDCGYRFSC